MPEPHTELMFPLELDQEGSPCKSLFHPSMSNAISPSIFKGRSGIVTVASTYTPRRRALQSQPIFPSLSPNQEQEFRSNMVSKGFDIKGHHQYVAMSYVLLPPVANGQAQTVRMCVAYCINRRLSHWVVFTSCPLNLHVKRMPALVVGFWDSEQGTQFMRGISRLRLLRIHVVDDYRSWQDEDRTPTLANINNSVRPALEQWRQVDGPLDSQLPAAARAPNLKYLTFRAYMNRDPEVVLLHTPALRSVKLPDYMNDFSTFFSAMLSACPLLDQLNLGLNKIDKDGFDALETHRPSNSSSWSCAKGAPSPLSCAICLVMGADCAGSCF
ncbi:hypothetical protein BDK51DRAFT_39149 [Blyttiomyces helicus]|uniref:F-box domain-containing protein n=1 Tax=Blyttiomyces helicus TaxID=388810 RepID=A0A4P9W743_9FUNG|nr:hypothetical protein BDK51DRAFT_39149 [Blyttiomyces helicus]|eukprot:RKO86828.1 hypothetical protein BDK51DRAFT_39149 [Blyttiomyces helicus]